MRLSPAFAFLALAVAAKGQQAPAPASLFTSTRVDAAIVVHKHPMGTDMVQVTVLKPTYSMDLLRKQISRLSQELHSEPRALQVYASDLSPADPNSRMVKASFGIDGLIDREKGVLHIQPLARAFALASSQDKLDALMIQFEEESPTSHTIKTCAAPSCGGVELEGRSSGANASLGVEYRVKYTDHDPDKISIPDEPRQKAATAAPAAKQGMDWMLIGLLLVAALAVGALVYSVLLRGRPRARA